LRVFADTDCVPIDNNTVERDMRQVAVGRKNYLFVGSEDAGAWCAAMYALIESARLTNIDVRAYLARAVAGLHAGEDAQSLTPKALRKQLPKAKAA
jgi:transposase